MTVDDHPTCIFKYPRLQMRGTSKQQNHRDHYHHHPTIKKEQQRKALTPKLYRRLHLDHGRKVSLLITY